MQIQKTIAKNAPEPIKKILRPIRNRYRSKTKEAMGFWRSRLENDKGTFRNHWYKNIMLSMAEESDDFLTGKIVADFGSGPRGTLSWAKNATVRIGIDLLADLFVDEFSDNVLKHGMVYLKSTEKHIPLPSNFVDIMFTLNAIDHVENFGVMCNEIIRVIKPGGYFIGSFNLNEPPTISEPHQLNENIIQKKLLDKLNIVSYRIAKRGPDGNKYKALLNGESTCQPGDFEILWVKATK